MEPKDATPIYNAFLDEHSFATQVAHWYADIVNYIFLTFSFGYAKEQGKSTTQDYLLKSRCLFLVYSICLITILRLTVGLMQ